MQATTVAAQGSAETDFNLAGFSVHLNADGGTALAAKAKLKNQVDALTQALDTMKTKLDLEFVKNSVTTSTNVQEHWEYNRKKNDNEFLGYKASYAMSFQIADLDKVSEVYDVLSSFEEVTTSSPTFYLKTNTRDRVNKKALKDAFRKVQERFETECSVLGLNAADFEIASWEATYSDSQRSDRVAAGTRRVGAMRAAMSYDEGVESAAAPVAAAAAIDAEPLEILVGKAKVTANLEVGYARKVVQTSPVKATVVKHSPRSEETTNV